MRIFDSENGITKVRRKNILAIGLMSSSIVLLVVLQFLWLGNTYQNAYADLKMETDVAFRSTVFGIWDSLVSNSITPFPFDSAVHEKRFYRAIKDSSVAIATFEKERIIGKTDSSEVRVIISTRDSTIPRDILKPLALKLDKINRSSERNPNQTFVINFASDTLDRKKLQAKLASIFLQSGIDTKFNISRSDHGSGPAEDFLPMHRGIMLRKKRVNVPSEVKYMSNIVSEPVGFGPMVEYIVTLENVKPLLIARIGPQIFFSLILTTLTATAFLLMYRNIRSQQRLVASKNEFINNVTHELKTPVSTVSVAIEALQNFNASHDPKLTKEYLEIAQRELKRLNEITDRILKTSVLEEVVLITEGTTDFDSVIQSVLSDMKLLLDQRQAKVSYIKEGVDFGIHCDLHTLYQMIENLIDNALKYSDDQPVIDISLLEDKEALVFKVGDQGIGIEKEHQGKIFEKFFRVPTGDVHTVKGYGLGLSYVHNFVKSLGGQISVESSLHQGTTFHLRFPKIHPKKISFKIGKA
jgi:two-component system, OmpR family, phosphate regulon sensor histidine kinase PhoR